MNTIIEPMRFVHAWRILNIGILVYLWIIGDAAPGFLVLILLLFIMASLRRRFALPAWCAALDAAMCLLFAAWSDMAYYGLALPVFELIFLGKWLPSLFLLTSLFIPAASSHLLFWLLLQACFFGWFAHAAVRNHAAYKKEADEQRKARYELERMRTELLEANAAVSQQAELMERHRISRELHDHLGHDLTGALLAVKAHEYAADPKEAGELLLEVRRRIENSTKNLRELVHNTTPNTLLGVERLANIARNFGGVEVHFQRTGEMQLVSPSQWGLLEACLMEALTNVARHSDATVVRTELQVTDTIVRLSVQDNGTEAVDRSRPAGSGLRSLRMRARYMGGSLFTSREDGFSVVCVLPVEQGGTVDGSERW